MMSTAGVTDQSGFSQRPFVKSLDQETSNFLQQFAKTFASIEHLPIPEQRQTIKEMFRVPESQLERIAKVENRVIEGKNGPIPLRLFIPKTEESLPVIVYFHRGGWVYGSVEESEGICRRLANATSSIVIAVEYRLAPEHKFPVPLEDCYDAAKWAVCQASSFGGNSDKVILCGESAGGNLAAAVALMARDKKEFSPAGQLLIYPVLTSELNPQHYQDSPDKWLLSYDNMKFFWGAYLSSDAESNNPYASPLKSHDLAELPQALIVTAEHDALKAEGQAYGKALTQAGVQQETRCYSNVIHGFLDLPLADPVKKQAIEDIADWMKMSL